MSECDVFRALSLDAYANLVSHRNYFVSGFIVSIALFWLDFCLSIVVGLHIDIGNVLWFAVTHLLLSIAYNL